MTSRGNPTIPIRMPEEDKARFKAAAHNLGTDASDLARRILAWWMGEEGAELPPRPGS